MSDSTEEVTFKRIRKSYERADLDLKVNLIAKELNTQLKHIKACTYDTNYFKGNIENPIGVAQIPLGIIGPLSVNGTHAKGDFWVPLATTEGALALTYDLGARLLGLSTPIQVKILSKGVHITPMFPILNNEDQLIANIVDKEYQRIKEIVESGSRHLHLLRIERKRAGNNFLLKFVYDTEDAQGLNMINQGSFNACKYIQSKTGCNFYHRSHYSGIKHFSLLNETAGQGRAVESTAIVSSKALGMLRVNAVSMKDFFDRCIYCAHDAGISSVNVHAANAITAIYIACGQDVADISCSHSCSTSVEIVNKNDLMIKCVLNNLMVGTVGGGTGLGTQSECLNIMGCLGSGKADKFAEIIAATVLAGEFPTAAAVISETYVDIHNKYGRNKNKLVRE